MADLLDSHHHADQLNLVQPGRRYRCYRGDVACQDIGRHMGRLCRQCRGVLAWVEDCCSNEANHFGDYYNVDLEVARSFPDWQVPARNRSERYVVPEWQRNNKEFPRLLFDIAGCRL